MKLSKKKRRISFEEIVEAINSGNVLDDIAHPNQKTYSKQKILVININNYAYYVPYVEDEKKIFLKTIIPSRKLTKKYISK